VGVWEVRGSKRRGGVKGEGEWRNETWGTEGGEQTCNCVLAIGLCPGSSVAYLLSL